MSELFLISAEASALLAASRRAFLLTLRADGSPTAHPMTGVFASGRLMFSTYRKAAKTRNARRDARTCALALQGYDDAGALAVVYRGTGRVIEGEAALAALRAANGSAPGPVHPSIATRAADRLAEGKRVVLAIDPVEVTALRAGEAEEP